MTHALDGARAARLRGARALFTARAGGESVGSWASLNLARHVGDDDTHVAANRARLAEAMGAPVVFVDQVHSPDVVVVDEDADLQELDSAPRSADALVTTRRDVALAVMVADCLPVLLVDEAAGVVGAVHAGRRGLLDGVLEAAVGAMSGLGAQPGRIRGEIGPSVCGRCYEVPGAMRDEAEARRPGIGSTTSWGTPSLDLRAGAVAALEGAGVPPRSVIAEPPCTVEDGSFFSYRREQSTGRFAGVIRLT